MAMTDIDSRIGLLDLPAELIELIARYVDDLDLLYLRQTCSQLSWIVTPIAGRVWFEYANFYLAHPRSMAALVDISKHPVFSKCVQILGLSFAELRSPADVEALRLEARSGSFPVEGGDRSRRSRAFEEMSRVQNNFRRSGDLYLRLREALLNFKSMKSFPRIEADGVTSFKPRKPVRHRAIARALGYNECFRDYQPDQVSFRFEPFYYKYILEAIRRTEFPVTQLSLGIGWMQGVKLKLLRKMPETNAFRNIVDLWLCLQEVLIDRHENYQASLYQNSGGLLHLFLQATELRRLNLYWDSALPRLSIEGTISPDRYAFNVMAAEARDDVLMRLEHLQLAGFMIDLRVLLRFLRVRRHTLDKVNLSCIRDGLNHHSNASRLVEEQFSGRPDSQPCDAHVHGCYDGWEWLNHSTEGSLDQATAIALFGSDTHNGQLCSITAGQFLEEECAEYQFAH